MSFLLDPPVLFILGMVLNLAGANWKLAEKNMIALGIIIVFLFISVSGLFYLDAIPCFIPFLCDNSSGSEYMFHSAITGIYKKDAPLVLVILLFTMYPLWHYAGYAFARKYLH